MTPRRHVADDLAEQLLADRNPISGDPLSIFCSDVRQASRSDLRASPTLSVVLAEGLSHDKGDLPVTAASNVTGPAPQASGLPNWRKNRMIPSLLTKLAAAGLAVKAVAATGAVVVAGSAIAATGNMPELPDQSDGQRVEVVEDEDAGRQDEDRRQDDGAGQDEGRDDVDGEEGEGAPEDTFGSVVQGLQETLEGAEFGQAVAEAAQLMGQEKAAEGRATADEASGGASEAGQANRPEPTPTADDNPGTETRTEHQPVTPPPAADAGSDARGDAGVEEQDDAGTQAPDEADGAGAPDDAGSQGSGAAAEGTSRLP